MNRSALYNYLIDKHKSYPVYKIGFDQENAIMNNMCSHAFDNVHNSCMFMIFNQLDYFSMENPNEPILNVDEIKEQSHACQMNNFGDDTEYINLEELSKEELIEIILNNQEED